VPAPAHVIYLAHIARWVVIDASGNQLQSYATRRAAQDHANRLNGEITREDH